jgi:hypothetical protein
VTVHLQGLGSEKTVTYPLPFRSLQHRNKPAIGRKGRLFDANWDDPLTKMKI